MQRVATFLQKVVLSVGESELKIFNLVEDLGLRARTRDNSRSCTPQLLLLTLVEIHPLDFENLILALG